MFTNLSSLQKRTLITGSIIALLLIVLPLAVLLVNRSTELRSRAATISNVDLPRFGAVTPIDLSTINEPTRTKPSLIFVQAQKVEKDARIQLLLTDNSGKEAVNNRGFGARMVTELLIDPGDYTLEVTSISESDASTNLFTTILPVDENTISLLMRTENGTPEGRFDIHQFTHSELSPVKFYNLSADSNLGIFGGTLSDYTQVYQIATNSYRNPAFNTYERITFGINTTLPQLSDRMVDIVNDTRQHMLFFVLGDTTDAAIHAVFIPLPEEFTEPKLTQTGTFQSTLNWCEGQFMCRLADTTCSSCGKICFPTPDRCDAGANGGSGTNWNGSKVIQPK